MFKNAMIIVFLLVLIPIQVNAEATKVIGERSAGGFHFKIIMDRSSFTWKIGSGSHRQSIQQSSENEQTLERFRVAVNEAAGHRFILILSAGYVFIIGLTTLVTFKKRKHIPLAAGLIIACLAVAALYATITNYIDMQAALQDAGYYYGTLLVE